MNREKFCISTLVSCTCATRQASRKGLIPGSTTGRVPQQARWRLTVDTFIPEPSFCLTTLVTVIFDSQSSMQNKWTSEGNICSKTVLLSRWGWLLEPLTSTLTYTTSPQFSYPTSSRGTVLVLVPGVFDATPWIYAFTAGLPTNWADRQPSSSLGSRRASVPSSGIRNA